MHDLDITLLRTFVSVADAGGFTRAGERVHRTQSTISQQIRRLEEQTGTVLLERSARAVRLTDDGERLLGYARRILALSDEARHALRADRPREVVRVGVTEDYAVDRLPALLARLARRDDLQLHVRCDLSIALRRDLEAGDLDIALVKQMEPAPTALAATLATTLATARVPLGWAGALAPVSPCADDEPVPLAVFPQGCVYRNHAIHVLEQARRTWRVAYASPNLAGVQAAVRAGLGISPLSPWEAAPGMRWLGTAEGLPALPDTWLALYGCADMGRGCRLVADLLADSLGKEVPDTGFPDTGFLAEPA